MKKLVRYMLIGVCFLLGYGWVEASDQASLDTIDACYGPMKIIINEIVKDPFSNFREADSSALIDRLSNMGDNTKYKVEYRDFQFEYTGDGVNGKFACTSYSTPIAITTDNLRNDYIYCTVTYSRLIHFNKVDLKDYDSEKAISKEELLGYSTDSYPKFVLESRREWHTVIRIKKNIDLTGENFAIKWEDTCLKDKVTLKVPEKYADMQCTWSCDNAHISMSNEIAPEITISRTEDPFLTTNIQCTIRNSCNGSSKPASIGIRSYHTPESTITVDIPGGDCISTFLAPITIPVTVSNEFEGVTFEWDPIELPLSLESNMRKSNNGASKTVDYPVPELKDFTIGVTTYGGCTASHTSKTVHRKLSYNVSVQVSDSYPVTTNPMIQFTVETDPPLPKMALRWTYPAHLNFNVSYPDKSRYDKFTLYKIGTVPKDPINVSVYNMYCPSGVISKEITL